MAAGRDSEALTRCSDVPTTWAGDRLRLVARFRAGHGLVGGIEGRYVRGRSDETAFAQGRATSEVSAGGAADDLGRSSPRDGSRWARGPSSPWARATTVGRENDGFSRTRPLTGAAPTRPSTPTERPARCRPGVAAVSRGLARAALRGRLRRLPRPHLERALPLVPGGRHPHPREPRPHRRAARGRRAGRHLDLEGPGRPRARRGIRVPPRGSGGQRHPALDPGPHHPPAAEPRPHALAGPRGRRHLRLARGSRRAWAMPSSPPP